MSLFSKSLVRRQRRGANAIEFALTLPVFLFITFGMMEYGWYFSQTAQVNGALATACREGSLIDPVNPPASMGGCVGDACITTRVETLLNTMINGANMSCMNCSAVVSGAVPAKVVECTAEVSYTPITGYLPQVVQVPDRINAYSRVRLEWQRIIFP